MFRFVAFVYFARRRGASAIISKLIGAPFNSRLLRINKTLRFICLPPHFGAAPPTQSKLLSRLNSPFRKRRKRKKRRGIESTSSRTQSRPHFSLRRPPFPNTYISLLVLVSYSRFLFSFPYSRFLFLFLFLILISCPFVFHPSQVLRAMPLFLRRPLRRTCSVLFSARFSRPFAFLPHFFLLHSLHVLLTPSRVLRAPFARPSCALHRSHQPSFSPHSRFRPPAIPSQKMRKNAAAKQKIPSEIGKTLLIIIRKARQALYSLSTPPINYKAIGRGELQAMRNTAKIPKRRKTAALSNVFCKNHQIFCRHFRMFYEFLKDFFKKSRKEQETAQKPRKNTEQKTTSKKCRDKTRKFIPLFSICAHFGAFLGQISPLGAIFLLFFRIMNKTHKKWRHNAVFSPIFNKKASEKYIFWLLYPIFYGLKRSFPQKILFRRGNLCRFFEKKQSFFAFFFPNVAKNADNTGVCSLALRIDKTNSGARSCII